MTLGRTLPSNSRRGISSVVGALIFTVLMIAGFSTMSLALDSQTDIVNTQRVVAEIELKKQQEQFGIAVSTNANNILNVSVDNNGQNPVEISRVWITNKTLATQPAKPFSVNSNDAFVPTGFTSNVLSTLPLYMMPDTYDVKVISALGTVRIAEVTVGSGPSSGGLRAELITDPPDVIIGQNVTVAMLVTNTGSSTIENVVPGTLTVNPSLAVLALSLPIPIYADLTPGESVLFSWDYTISGTSGDDVTFSSYASGTDIEDSNVVTSNTVSDVSTLRLPTDGGSGQVEIDILSDELLARPQLFLTAPGPDGDSSYNALWGVNVANPVNATMTVSKITLLLTGPGITGNGNLFDCGAGNLVVVEGPSNWSCPNPDTLMWENTVSPVTIPPFSTRSFSVMVEPDQHTGQPSSMEAVNIQTNVFTSAGSFGKSGYQTTMNTGNTVVGNVYLSTVVDSITSTNMKSSLSGIAPGSTQTFNIVFADLDGNTSTFVNRGQLIINVPKEWTNVIVLNNPTSGFINPAVVNAFGDNSHQIVATLPSCATTTCMGGSVGNPSNTIQFSAIAPSVTTDHMYVMYILATGESNNIFTMGPVSEVVLQVDAP